MLSAAARCGMAGLLVLAFAASLLRAESFTDQRVKSGIKIFRVILKGDADIAKKVSPDGVLVLLLIGEGRDSSPQKFADLLAEVQGTGDRSQVAGRPVQVKVIAAGALDTYGGAPVAGLFVAEPLSDSLLRKVVDFGVERHVISFSPFESDVEKGILCGLSVEAKLAPFINLRTLKESGISMSPFVLKVAKTHE